MIRRKRLGLAIAAGLLALPAFAQTAGNTNTAATIAEEIADAEVAGKTQRRGHEQELEEVTVTASPLGAGDELVQPVSVLAGPELEDRRAATLGETVSQQAGVQSSFFGPGVGRPIIRGLEGARVQVLEGGVASLDVSTVSADHAVTIEPFLADQIEVLKGPSTLLFGAGAIGGVVNVVDGRIPEVVADGVTGRAELRGNTVSDERTGMARVDAGAGNFALHADVLRRRTDDYETPSNPSGLLQNSAVETDAGALGVSGFGEFGFAGLSVSRYETLYGIPIAEDGGDEGAEAVKLDLDQTRVDGKVAWESPFAGVERIILRAGHNEYEHVELEGDEVGTRFQNQAWDARAEIVHSPIAQWEGAFGVQVGHRDFAAIGEEAFVPPNAGKDIGFFVLEQRDFEPLKVEVGMRYDAQDVETDDGRDADFSALSISAGAVYDFTEAWHVSLNLDRAQRAPSAEELFSSGPHIATQSIEMGDASLREETANQVEFGVHHHTDALELGASVYLNDFDDFVYLVDTGEMDADEGLPIRQWTQADARFTGFEAEGTWVFADNDSGEWKWRLFGDLVRARLRDGGDLPRIAPARIGSSLAWQRDAWRANVGAIRHAEQDRVAELEAPTEGYTLVNAHLSYALNLDETEVELFVDGTNLTDREARSHTSFLRDIAPLPGRGIAFGIRAFW